MQIALRTASILLGVLMLAACGFAPPPAGRLDAPVVAAGAIPLQADAAERAAPPPIRWLRSLPPGVYGVVGLILAALAGLWSLRWRRLERIAGTFRTEAYLRNRTELAALAQQAQHVLEERRPVFELCERHAVYAQLQRKLAAYDAERAEFTPERDVRKQAAAQNTLRGIRALRSRYEALLLEIRNAARTPEEEAALNAALLDHVSGRKRLPINPPAPASPPGSAPASDTPNFYDPNYPHHSNDDEHASSGNW
jgi:hypothetical protein